MIGLWIPSSSSMLTANEAGFHLSRRCPAAPTVELDSAALQMRVGKQHQFAEINKIWLSMSGAKGTNTVVEVCFGIWLKWVLSPNQPRLICISTTWRDMCHPAIWTKPDDKDVHINEVMTSMTSNCSPQKKGILHCTSSSGCLVCKIFAKASMSESWLRHV